MYKVLLTRHFKKNFDILTSRDKQLKSQLEIRINEMIEHKISDFKALKAENWKGRFSTRVGTYRIIYVYCEDCKRCGYVPFNNCTDCEKDDNLLILVDVHHRSNAYKNY